MDGVDGGAEGRVDLGAGGRVDGVSGIFDNVPKRMTVKNMDFQKRISKDSFRGLKTT